MESLSSRPPGLRSWNHFRPGDAPAAIAAEAIENERFFWCASVGGQSYLAIPSNEELEAVVSVYGYTTGGIVDVAAIGSDSGGCGCRALAAHAL